MKLRPLRLVLVATAAVGVAGSGLAACFDWGTPNASAVDSGQPDASTTETGLLPETGVHDASDDDALPGCGPPITPPPAPPSFHLTLDDLASLATPLAGSGIGFLTTATESDFVPGVCGNALRFKTGIHLSYPEVPQEGGEAGTPNINFAEGTLMFWYLPDYPAVDRVDHAIVQTGPLNRGSIRVTSRRTYGGLDFDCFNGNIQSPIALAPRRWVHVTLTWTAGAAPRLFLNGVLDSSQPTITAGDAAVPAAVRRIGFGNGANQAPDAGEAPAEGLIDDLRIYPVALPP